MTVFAINFETHSYTEIYMSIFKEQLATAVFSPVFSNVKILLCNFQDACKITNMQNYEIYRTNLNAIRFGEYTKLGLVYRFEYE